jgi:hypothetical protein
VKAWLLWFCLACVAGVALLLGLFWLFGGLADLDISGAGWGALVGTVVLVLVVGVGLMALVFYSSRSGRDDAVADEVDPEPPRGERDR